jgi:short subunit fatty acids transporter
MKNLIQIIIILIFLLIIISSQKDELTDMDQKHTKEMKKVLTSSMPQTMQGHTGFLTFATLSPEFAR